MINSANNFRNDNAIANNLFKLSDDQILLNQTNILIAARVERSKELARLALKAGKAGKAAFKFIHSTVWGMVENYMRYYRTVNELASMSDRELSDIGIYRGMISDVARSKYIPEDRYVATKPSLIPVTPVIPVIPVIVDGGKSTPDTKANTIANGNETENHHLAA